MPIFKPKKGRLLRWSRIVHFLIAMTATGYGGHLGGYQGSIWTGLAVIAGGLLWELSNKWFPKLTISKVHPYADAVDFWAFVSGAVVAGMGWIIFGA